MACPHKSSPSPQSSCAPPWHIPINQCHRPVPASVASPHKSIPSTRSSQCRKPPWINPIAPIQPGSHGPMNQSHLSGTASVARPWKVRVRCSWSQVSASQHYRNLPPGSLSEPVSILLPPGPTPLSVLIRRPSPLLPYATDSLLPLHPGPGLLDPSSGTPCQPHLPFRFPVHRLHWSRHSLG